jgi:Lrp/AsnC family leucine-responsive transcriptional regulator
VIDEIDRDILSVLQSNARLSFKELAERVGLSANAVADRMRKLSESGVIRAFRAEIDPAAVGLTLSALIEVKMEPDTTADAFEARAQSVPGVLRAMVTTGRYDWVLEVAAKDQLDLQRIIEALRTGGLVRDTYSRIVARDRRFALSEFPSK